MKVDHGVCAPNAQNKKRLNEMAKQEKDKATRDILNPNQHGGFRSGAGRKKNTKVEKTKLGWYVTSEAKNNIQELAKNKDYTPAELVDYLMKKLKKAPKNLD